MDGRRLARAGFATSALAGSGLLAVTALARVVASGGNDHQLGDWLINYADGFVRRGLFGELLLRSTPVGSTLWVLFGFLVLAYLPVYWFFVRFLRRSDWSWSAIALACGPAALPFIGWDTLGGFRKEVLGFVVLVVLATLRSGGPRRPGVRAALTAGALLLWAVAGLSWEPTVVMLPAVWHLVLSPNSTSPTSSTSQRERARRHLLAAAFTGVALVVVALSLYAHGSDEVAGIVCGAVVQHGMAKPGLCGGAIMDLGQSLGYSLARVGLYFPLYLGYVPLAVVAALPLATTPWLRRNWRWALVSTVAVAPLFVIGIDYGRWLHLWFMMLAICVASAPRAQVESRAWTPLSTVLYVALPGIPHADPLLVFRTDRWPFVGLLASILAALPHR